MSQARQRIDMSDEPDHDDLCEREQSYLLKAIEEDLDLSDHMNEASKSLKSCLRRIAPYMKGRSSAYSARDQ